MFLHRRQTGERKKMTKALSALITVSVLVAAFMPAAYTAMAIA